ncbi:hypothetical protein [Campylobacter concisus]|jgi:hypothetical protein|uniref:hypothetical protein n=1 Tax=Campylobacter concisus TaxID=199 RepID=UPI00122C9A61|nr:hypothetical protein [Campylobacter concisus]
MTKKEQILQILQDKEWHCCSCEFAGISSQIAAQIRDLREDGYCFETDGENSKRYCQAKYCSKCDRTTIHRKLLGNIND